MDAAGWVTIAVAIVGAAAVVSGQFIAARGEPSRLRTIKMLNEVIASYDGGDEGRRELIVARAHLSTRVAAAITKEPWWSVASSFLPPTLVAIVAALTTAAVGLWLDPTESSSETISPELLIKVASGFLGVAALAAAAAQLARTRFYRKD
jgi:hypothetical protein